MNQCHGLERDEGNAKKVRKLGENILVGFAGSTADALTLVERLEKNWTSTLGS